MQQYLFQKHSTLNFLMPLSSAGINWTISYETISFCLSSHFCHRSPGIQACGFYISHHHYNYTVVETEYLWLLWFVFRIYISLASSSPTNKHPLTSLTFASIQYSVPPPLNISITHLYSFGSIVATLQLIVCVVLKQYARCALGRKQLLKLNFKQTFCYAP